MKNRKRRDYLGVLLLLVVGLSVGYALLRTNLTINGTSKIKGNTWDIHFENLNVTDGSVELSDGDVAAVINTTTRTDVSYAVTLKEPGDFYEFTVDAVNAGTIDGMIESITSKLNNTPITTLPAYLDYSVTYSDGKEIAVNHLLKAGKTEKYQVRIEFKKDIESSDLPTTEQTLTLDFGVVYIQADSSGVEVERSRFVYTLNKYSSEQTGGNSLWVGREYNEAIRCFETPSEAINAALSLSGKNLPFYVKHKIRNGIVTEQYVEFIITDAMAQENPGMVPGTYSLKGEKTYEWTTLTWLVGTDYISLDYDSNKEEIKTAFGYETNPDRCSESGTGRSIVFSCRVSSIRAFAGGNGSVSAYVNYDYCALDPRGYDECYWSS